VLRLADVDGDGRGDIVLRNADGMVKVWLMNGTTIKADVDLGTADRTWSYFASGDFDGHGMTDIVWKKADDTLVVWLNATFNGALSAPTVIDNAGQAPQGAIPVEL